MILEGPAWSQVLKVLLAVAFLGTAILKMVTGEWWWKSMKK